MSKEGIIEKLNKVYGKNAVQKVKKMDLTGVRRDPSGSMEIDNILGGGYYRGGLIEIFGWESSGKTTLTIHAIAEKQKALKAEKDDRDVAFIDMEHALDLAWCKTLGVDTDELVISQPNNGEEALEIIDSLIKSGEFAMVVLDSAAAARPKKEIEGEMGDQAVGLQAKLFSQACPKLAISASKNDCTTFMINQFRQKIGVVFGSPNTTPAGNALKFYTHQRVEVTNAGQILDPNSIRIGNKTRVKCVKNKASAPFMVCETRLTYGVGIDRVYEIFRLAIDAEIVVQSGSWFSFGDGKLGQGEVTVINHLRQDEDTFEAIEHMVMQAIRGVKE